MCGIAGIFSKSPPDPAVLLRMAQSIVHRGPDDQGIWINEPSGIGFAHRRLAIVDLSPSGHQPMVSANARYVLSFNGEIYNHQQLRIDLEALGATPPGGWRGHSDTETLLHAISTWGLDRALAAATGMFAISLWDSETRTLSLVRDRFGEKPLYYGWVGPDFVFGSELKSFRLHPQFDNPISGRALHLFASRAYVPSPLSIYERIFKVPPGCILELKREACSASLTTPPEQGRFGQGICLRRYWSYRDMVLGGLATPIVDANDALQQLDRALAFAIRDQSIADVPVGAFLSGGIDSSTIVSLYQQHSNVPVRTFTIGFEEAAYNEADDARKVAQYLGTVHHEHRVTSREVRDAIPLLPQIYDEPFADSSQIPTYLVSRLAHEQVKVALTGDGGDELFAGYARHFSAPQIWRRVQRVPRPIRSLSGALLGKISSDFWSRTGNLLPGRRQPHFGAKVQKALGVLSSARTIDDVYSTYLDEWSLQKSPVRTGKATALGRELDLGGDTPDSLRVMYWDATEYLPDDILCKVDRASMAVSLETRVPFLDHRVAEVAARIPLSMKVEHGRGKQIIRRVLSSHVPSNLFERPKAGFAIPVGDWIKGPLRGWAEDLLDAGRIQEDGWFDAAVVQERWKMHVTGRRSSTQALWAILMFQAWFRQEADSRRAAA